MAQSSLVMLNVTRQAPELIPPAGPTPYEFKELSDIDDQDGLRFQIPVIQFYRNEQYYGGSVLTRTDPAKVIKEAVAKALVPYYPFAGRLREKENMKLVVECNGEGVIFIEAYANVTLKELGDVTGFKPPFLMEELLFDVPGSSGVLGTPLIIIQATRLKCGGFILALRLNHTMADGPGLALFMNAVAEFARGAKSPRIRPVWMRHLLSARNPPQITCEHREYEEVVDTKGTITTLGDTVHTSFFFGPSEIANMKRLIPPHQKASTFEIITACLWRCRTIALQLDLQELVRLICIVNFRYRLNSFIPSGYYGNALAFPVAISTAGKLSTNPIAYALDLVKQAKAIVTQEYMQSLVDFMVLKGRPHFTTFQTFLVSDVTRAGFEVLDFGWGPPVYGGPAEFDVREIPGMVSYYVPFKNKKEEKGIQVHLYLPENAMDVFVKEMNKLVGQVPEHYLSKAHHISSSL